MDDPWCRIAAPWERQRPIIPTGRALTQNTNSKKSKERLKIIDFLLINFNLLSFSTLIRSLCVCVFERECVSAVVCVRVFVFTPVVIPVPMVSVALERRVISSF